MVEVQSGAATVYGECGGRGARLAFLIKQQAADGLNIEGRSGDRELLAGLLEEMASQLTA